MRIYRPTYTDKKTGKRRHQKRYWIEVQDTLGANLYLPAFTNKGQSVAFANSVTRLINARMTGSDLSPDLQAFVDSLNLPGMAKIRDKLIERDVLGASSLPLHRHLLAYLRHLQGKGNTQKHVTGTMRRCLRVLKGIDARVWSDVSAGRVQAYLQQQRTQKRKPISTTTANHCLRAIKMLSRFIHRSGRAGSDQLISLQAFKPLPDEQRKCERRALTIDEARALLYVAENGPKSGSDTESDANDHHGMDGLERSLLYRLAIETGLRANELRSLTRASFDLQGELAAVHVTAGKTKNRKGASIDLSIATAELLRTHLQNKLPGAAAFSLPHKGAMARMLRRASKPQASLAKTTPAARWIFMH